MKLHILILLFLLSCCNLLNALQILSVQNNYTDLKRTTCLLLSSSEVNSVVHRADQEASFLLPNQSHLQMDTTRPFSETLKQRGVSRVDRGLSVDLACKMQDYIDKTLASSLGEVNSYKIPRAFRFANVLEKQNRWDLLLPFDDAIDTNSDETIVEGSSSSSVVMDALGELLGEGGSIGKIIEDILGEEAILYELACLISDPGSMKQEIHPDIAFQANGGIPLIACFVSLQDIDSTMGPTVFLQDTVSADHHRCINDAALADSMLQTIPSSISTLNAGDCSLYNPMVLHAGGGNVSNRRRRLFYFTFLNTNEYNDPSHDYNPGSIRPDVKGRALSLREMRLSLESYTHQQ
mmetsp:Transcript_11150/g.16916  ORF Transcript_11150/g.16916 Transcript_11150/m.16916 type:complete len:350 (-) Transcript_11150:1436-2485(-)